MIWIIFVAVLVGMVFVSYLKKTNKDQHSSNETNTSSYRSSTQSSSYTSTTRTESSIPQNAKKVNFAVKGTMYCSAADINAARRVRVGDELTLIHEPHNDKDTFAMMVMTSDGSNIGYVEKKYSMCFFVYRDNIYKCIVSKVTNDDVPFIYANAFLPFDARIPDDDLKVKKMMSKDGQYIGNGVTVKITTERSLAQEANPDLDIAEKLKYSDPEKAVEIFLSCAANESGLYSLHQACICYRKMKAYDKEKELILQILGICKEEGFDESIATYESRLSTVESLINKGAEKGSIAKAYKLQKEGKYIEALEIFNNIFSEEKFILPLTEHMIQCYRKLDDTPNELRMLEYALNNKLSEANRQKFEKRLNILKNK